jgi:hypothetical protein
MWQPYQPPPMIAKDKDMKCYLQAWRLHSNKHHGVVRVPHYTDPDCPVVQYDVVATRLCSNADDTPVVRTLA